MAQADFNFIKSSTGSPATPAGGDDGTTQDNSLLSNPLTGYGTYSRAYTWGGGAGATTIMGAVSASVDSGIWANISNTYSYSIRASVRTHTTGNFAVGVALKSGRIDAAAVPSKPSGYYLYVGKFSWGFDDPGAAGNLTLTMQEENPNNFSNFKNVTINTSSTAANWHRIRMDLIPNGGQDIIKVYTAPMAPIGSEVWTLDHTETILNTDPHYCNWGDPTSHRVGYLAHTNGGGASNYVDGLVVMREAV